jgi:elongation factor Ts
MAAISMDLVKQLRDKTQVGMMDCKKALEEANGDFDGALDLLRKKGAAVAAKRADNATTQGRVECFLSSDHTVGALVETACETDFSANTDSMKQFIIAAATEGALNNPASIDDLLALPLSSNPALTVKSLLDELIAKICENIKINRYARLQAPSNGFVNAYIHPGSSIGVMVELAADKDVAGNTEVLAQIAKDVCMQAAVTNPVAIRATELDPAVVEKERAFALDQMKDSGKPANVIEKIIEGKIAKFYQDACLLNQAFIKNDKLTVQQYIDEAAKATGLKLTVKAIHRFAIGR